MAGHDVSPCWLGEVFARARQTVCLRSQKRVALFHWGFTRVPQCSAAQDNDLPCLIGRNDREIE